jgi:hypothetical protein
MYACLFFSNKAAWVHYMHMLTSLSLSPDERDSGLDQRCERRIDAAGHAIVRLVSASLGSERCQ